MEATDYSGRTREEVTSYINIESMHIKSFQGYSLHHPHGLPRKKVPSSSADHIPIGILQVVGSLTIIAEHCTWFTQKFQM